MVRVGEVTGIRLEGIERSHVTMRVRANAMEALVLYFRDNVAGVHREWWYHRHGCGLWFVAERDTTTNEVVSTEVPR